MNTYTLHFTDEIYIFNNRYVYCVIIVHPYYGDADRDFSINKANICSFLKIFGDDGKLYNVQAEANLSRKKSIFRSVLSP